jgi:hypothetical protein
MKYEGAPRLIAVHAKSGEGLMGWDGLKVVQVEMFARTSGGVVQLPFSPPVCHLTTGLMTSEESHLNYLRSLYPGTRAGMTEVVRSR